MFSKMDPVVKKETLFNASCVIILTVLMEAVFAVLGYWDMRVLWGGLLGAFSAILNFLMMGLTLQRALERDPKNAQSLVKASASGRLLMQLAFCAVGAALPKVFNLLAVLIPLLFPRIGVMVRQLVGKDK